jgi:hypothetical protein
MKLSNELNVEDMTLEDIQKLIENQIETGKGLISYRSHLLLLKKFQENLEELSKYRKDLVKKIDVDIVKLEEGISNIKETIKETMKKDDSIRKTDSGGKTIKLPDIGTASLSKETKKIVIEDAQLVAEKLGEDFIKVVKVLDKTKVKKHIETLKSPIEGTKIEKRQILTIRFN